MSNQVVLFFSVLGVLGAVLAFIALWSPRKIWVKVTALVATTLFLPVAYGALADLLSRPKPIGFEWSNLDVTEAAVLGSRLEEGQAIYLWLAIDGLPEPRSYVLPWDQEMAEQLHKAQRDAEVEGTGVQMQMPFEPSLDNRERRFYAQPQEPRPLKQKPPDHPTIFKKS